MKKNILKVKNDLTVQDRVNVIETIASVFFKTKEDDGSIEYTPYFKEIGQITAIAKFIIEGLEFEDNENVYESVVDDGRVHTLVKEVLNESFFYEIMDEVKDIVEYRKKEQIARIQNEANSILTYKLLELIEKEQEKTQREIEANDNLNAWVDEQRKYQEELNAVIPIEKQKEFFENFDMDAMSQSIYKQISEGNLHKLNEENVKLIREIREKDRIIGEKDKIIDFQQKEFAKEK